MGQKSIPFGTALENQNAEAFAPALDSSGSSIWTRTTNPAVRGQLMMTAVPSAVLTDY